VGIPFALIDKNVLSDEVSIGVARLYVNKRKFFHLLLRKAMDQPECCGPLKF